MSWFRGLESWHGGCFGRPHMNLRILLALSLVAGTAAAQPAPRPAPRQAPKPPPVPDDMAAFERDLDALFASGGLTADQAASRAAGASPTVRRRAAEIEAAIAQTESAELARVPVISARASYTRLSHIDLVAFGMALPSLDNAYLAEAQLVVPLSDYLLRYPRLIAAARLGADAARIGKRSSEIGAGQDARLAYYEWVRARFQVLIAKRQLVQVQRTLDQVRALAEAQRLSKADLMRVESQDAQAEQVVDQLENLSQLREEQLRLLIGAPAGEPLAVGEDIRANVEAPGSSKLDDLMATAKRQRLEFKSIDTGIQAKESQRAAEKANLLPRLSAFAVADYADPNQRIFPQKNEFRLTWSVGAQVTWALPDVLQSVGVEFTL